MNKVKLTMGAPVVVAQADPEERRWGYVQFPVVERLGGGAIHIEYHVAADSATAYGGGKAHAVSRDEGASFTRVEQRPADGGLLMPNGDRVRVKHLPSYPLDEIKLPEPAKVDTGGYGDAFRYYRAEDVPREYRGFSIERLPAGSGDWETETKVVDVPGAMMYDVHGVFPHEMLWRLRQEPNGRLWGILYPYCQNDVGGTGWTAAFAVSDDSGKTFRYLSKIPYQSADRVDPWFDERDGFTEPDVAFMPDGSVICLLRTEDGDNHGNGPLYIARSEDGGKTWSMPRAFDDLGVWPDLLTLKNGVTLACYGRPGLYVRATADPAGLKWDDRVTVVKPLQKGKDSCSYAGLLALGDNEALLAYSDFNYPDPDGKPAKTILACRIKAEK